MLGKPVPDFSLPSTSGTPFRLSDARGAKLVLYFYPKDNTPGCTLEGADFRDAYKDFQRAGCEVFGVSRDSLRSHENFKAKMQFPFALLSDADEALCKRFKVMKLKNMYGRKVRGIERLRAELIGRDEELTRLREALAEVWRGRGQMVSLIGEAGVGKSRLVAELKAGCRVQGVNFVRYTFFFFRLSLLCLCFRYKACLVSTAHNAVPCAYYPPLSRSTCIFHLLFLYF